MKHSARLAAIAATFAALLTVLWAQGAAAQMSLPSYTIVNIATNAMHQQVSRETPPPKKEAPTLTHAQDVWLGALEWCESRGDPSAINKKDRDGTPSYGAFQFKPSTLILYAKQYGLEATSTMDYRTQRKVVEAMVLDQARINWNQEFPDCVKRLGKPPAGGKL